MRSEARRGLCIRASMLATATVMAVGILAAPALAQTREELQAARELFQDAYKDEQEQRFPEALEKFKRVAKVKESASVRYRIATVLASMGRLREARDVYRAIAASRTSLSPADQEIADSAAERAAELDRRVPRLSVRLQDDPPPDVRVTIDGAPVPVSTTPRSVELDPGEHVVSATGRGSKVHERTLTLDDGAGEVSHTITFTADESSAAAPLGARHDTLAWTAVGGGAALFVTGTVLLAVREGLIDDIETACPNDICPTRLRDTVESDRDTASLLGPLGGAFAVAGLVAVGAGVYMLVRSRGDATSVMPNAMRVVRPGPGGLRLALSF